MRAILTLLGVLLAAGCGGATTATSTSGTLAANAIAGVYVRHDSANTRAVTPAVGVQIGLYTRPYSPGGPVMLDPPQPIMTTRTDAQGRFHFTLPDPQRRYFVAALDRMAYGGGHWVRAGSTVTLSGCTDCPRPLAAATAG